jgi:hypothetical protein
LHGVVRYDRMQNCSLFRTVCCQVYDFIEGHGSIGHAVARVGRLWGSRAARIPRPGFLSHRTSYSAEFKVYPLCTFDWQRDDAQGGSAVARQWQQSRHFRAARFLDYPDSKFGLPGESRSPRDYDRIVEELRYRDIKVPRQLVDISIRRRIENILSSVYGALKGIVMWTISIPSALSRARKMSLAEWRETLTSWWVTIKHEVHHYWVRMLRCGVSSLLRTTQLDSTCTFRAVPHRTYPPCEPEVDLSEPQRILDSRLRHI